MEAARPTAPAIDLLPIARFAASLNGTLVLPDDEAYEDARQIHNAVYDRPPP